MILYFKKPLKKAIGQRAVVNLIKYGGWYHGSIAISGHSLVLAALNYSIYSVMKEFLILYYRRQTTPKRGFHLQGSTIWKFGKRRLSVRIFILPPSANLRLPGQTYPIIRLCRFQLFFSRYTGTISKNPDLLPLILPDRVSRRIVICPICIPVLTVSVPNISLVKGLI